VSAATQAHEPAGAYVRAPSEFRDWVTADGSSPFPAEPGRYHLYVSWACPWAHRTIILRRLKRLEGVVGMSAVDPIRDERGWAFRDVPGAGPDPVNGFRYLAQAYRATRPDYRGRVNVPVLWDTHTRRIVNNESADVIVMLNAAFDAYTDATEDYYPPELRAEIDELNERVYERVNNGVYRCGFARSQEAYEAAVVPLFETLDWLEERLGERDFLVGERVTLADWRLFTTLVRFDAVYYTHFKCNLRRIVDYPNLWAFTRRLFAVPGVAETVKMDQIKRHYYMTHSEINPRRIVPIGPDIDFADRNGG
jgi:glutathionyl-hydroquinone reductase